jgi:hypothetical protein
VSGLSTRLRTLGPVATELHASVCALLGALLLAADTIRLAQAGWPWAVFAVPLGLGAALGLVSALLPWLWPALPLAGHRALIWGGWSIATLTAILALLPLDYGALLGAQLLLFGAVLPEMSGRPASLRWFWIALILTVAMMLIYREVADVRPVAG